MTDWCLLDHGVHGRDALGHDQRLTVGDVVEGRARVTGQNHLGEGAGEVTQSGSGIPGAWIIPSLAEKCPAGGQ